MRFAECAINGCCVGTLKDRIERVRSNLKPPRFIRVTKVTQEQWSIVANQTLRSRQNICEKHFSSNKFGLESFVRDIPKDRDTGNWFESDINISDGFEEFEDKVNETDEDPLKIDDEDSEIDDLEELNGRDEILEYTHQSSEDDSKHLETQKTSEKKYSLNDIQTYFNKTPIAENISWCRNFKDNEIVLIRTDFKGRVHCIFKIKNDLTVKALTSDNKVEIRVNNIVQNNEKLLKVLKMMLNKQWCEGTGNQNNSRSTKCTGFIYKNEMPKIKLQYSRCLSCKTLRHVEAKKEKRHLQRMIERREIADDATISKQRKTEEFKKQFGSPILDHSYVKKTTVCDCITNRL